jgi:hypothetical protein
MLVEERQPALQWRRFRRAFWVSMLRRDGEKRSREEKKEGNK